MAIPKEKESSKKKYLVIGLVIFLFIALCLSIAASLYIYKKNSDNSDEENQSDEQGENEDGENGGKDIDAEEEFDGEYITAALSDDWTITEYKNGQGGYGMLSEGNYSGLTAIVIRNAQGQDMFKVQGTNGIGGIDACDKIYKFPDTSTAYISEKTEISQEYFPDVEVIQINENYSSFEFLGKKARRIDNKVYWDSTPSANTFDPHCGALIQISSNTGLSFNVSVGGTQDTLKSYAISVASGITKDQAEILQPILTSVKVK